MDIQPERLAYWYLRLNGFLTIPNFVVHPDTGSNQETEVDVLGVRFPYRAENLDDPMEDDSYFTTVRDKPFVVSQGTTGSEKELWMTFFKLWEKTITKKAKK